MVMRSRALLLSAASKTVEKSANGAAKAVAAAKTADVADDIAERGASPADVSAGKSSTPSITVPPPYILLHHHRDPSLFPPRRPGSLSYVSHHLTSTVAAVASLFSSQDARDQFLEWTGPPNNSSSDGKSDDNNEDGSESNIYNNCIINTNVLGQSDMGFLKSFTLFQDLNSPLYKEYGLQEKIDVKEFMKGCGFALEKFHQAKEDLFRKDNFHKWAEKAVADAEDDLDDNKHGFAVPGQLLEMKQLAKINEYDFLKVAKEEPESVESLLMDMTTPIGWEFINFNARMRMLVGSEFDQYRMRSWGNGAVVHMGNGSETGDAEGYHLKDLKQDATKVVHVALLSARVEEFAAPSTEDRVDNINKNNDPDAPLEDDSLTPHKDVPGEDLALQVVTQLEVLYDLEQTFEKEDGRTHTQTAVMVANFEACLYGDPNGDELRWRLCSLRPAFEFGYSNMW